MWEGYQLERTSTPLLLHYNDGTTWASYQIRKIAGCTCAGNARNVFPTHRLERKPLVSDPDMHHGTCRDARAVMHVGIACLRWRGKRSRHSRRMRTSNFTYLVRGPLEWKMYFLFHSLGSLSSALSAAGWSLWNTNEGTPVRHYIFWWLRIIVPMKLPIAKIWDSHHSTQALWPNWG